MRLFGHDHHHNDDPLAGASPVEVECFFMLAYIIENQERMEKIMSDLTDAVDALDAALTKNNAEIETLLTKITAPATTDAEVAAAVARIRTLTAANTDEVAKAQAATP
jgi:hypothetical protein